MEWVYVRVFGGEQLFIETKSIFGTKWVELNQSKPHSISVQDSNISVNNVPIKHLVIETEGPASARAVWQSQELYWLAGRLKDSLDLRWKSRLDIGSALDRDDVATK